MSIRPQAMFAGSLNGVTAAGITDPLPAIASDRSWARTFAPQIRVLVALTGSVINTDITLSLGTSDGSGILAWSPPQTQELRTLPDDSVVVGVYSFETLDASEIRIALESDISGGGSVKLYYCFIEG